MVALCQRSEDRDRKTTCEQVYPVKFDSGRIEIDGVQYRSIKAKKSELERLLQLLSAEPLGFPRSSVHFIGFQRILPLPVIATDGFEGMGRRTCRTHRVSQKLGARLADAEDGRLGLPRVYKAGRFH